jgi:hypothetical protein
MLRLFHVFRSSNLSKSWNQDAEVFLFKGPGRRAPPRAKDANDARQIQSRNIFASLKNKIVQI